MLNSPSAELSRSTHISVIDASGERTGTGKSPVYLLGWTIGEGGGVIGINIGLVNEAAVRPLWSESYDRRSNQPGDDLANRMVVDIAGVLLAHAAAEQETGSARAAAAFSGRSCPAQSPSAKGCGQRDRSIALRLFQAGSQGSILLLFVVRSNLAWLRQTRLVPS